MGDFIHFKGLLSSDPPIAVGLRQEALRNALHQDPSRIFSDQSRYDIPHASIFNTSSGVGQSFVFANDLVSPTRKRFFGVKCSEDSTGHASGNLIELLKQKGYIDEKGLLKPLDEWNEFVSLIYSSVSDRSQVEAALKGLDFSGFLRPQDVSSFQNHMYRLKAQLDNLKNPELSRRLKLIILKNLGGIEEVEKLLSRLEIQSIIIRAPGSLDHLKQSITEPFAFILPEVISPQLLVESSETLNGFWTFLEAEKKGQS